VKALIVSIHMKPEYRDKILAGALEDARGSQQDEPGCLRFDVIQDDADPNKIYFYEIYKDDAAFEAHLKAPHFPAWRDLPADWFVGQKATVVRGKTISPPDERYR
jgi:autoinducer 2-degrading protein